MTSLKTLKARKTRKINKTRKTIKKNLKYKRLNNIIKEYMKALLTNKKSFIRVIILSYDITSLTLIRRIITQTQSR